MYTCKWDIRAHVFRFIHNVHKIRSTGSAVDGSCRPCNLSFLKDLRAMSSTGAFSCSPGVYNILSECGAPSGCHCRWWWVVMVGVLVETMVAWWSWLPGWLMAMRYYAVMCWLIKWWMVEVVSNPYTVSLAAYVSDVAVIRYHTINSTDCSPRILVGNCPPRKPWTTII